MCIVYYTIYAIFPILMYYDKIYNLGQYFFQSESCVCHIPINYVFYIEIKIYTEYYLVQSIM